MAAYSGEKNIKFSSQFNTIKVGNYTPDSTDYPSSLNIFNNIYIYDVLHTPVPVAVDTAELNTIFSSAFNTNDRYDPSTYIEWLQVNYKGEHYSYFNNTFINLPQVDNYVPAPIIPEGGQLNTYFIDMFNIYQTTINQRLPYIKKTGQMWPKVSGGYRYGGNTDY